jgi:hypothetical protein
MNKSLKIFVGVIFTLLPIFFTLLVSFNSLQSLKDQKILGDSVDVPSWNLTLTIFTIIIPIVYIGFSSLQADRKVKKIEDRTSSLLEMTKDSFYSMLREICDNSKLPVEMKLPLRIYKPIYSEFTFINFFLKFSPKRKPIKFVAISLDGKPVNNKPQYYVRNTKKMKDPIPQGIVGKSYAINELVVDDNLKENSLTYNLTQFQYDKVLDLDFAISYPLRNPKGNIMHIVTLDCREEFKVPEEAIERFSVHVKKYINEVGKNFPQLFP